MNGKMPKKSGEIAVDRMYADNNELKVGDTVKSRKKTFGLQVLWHFPNTVHYFRIIMIRCLML